MRALVCAWSVLVRFVGWSPNKAARDPKAIYSVPGHLPTCFYISDRLSPLCTSKLPFSANLGSIFFSKEVLFFKFQKFQEERPRHQWRWSWWTTYSWESEEWWQSSTSFGSMDLWVCVFFVIVFLFATGTSFKSKANTNHRCAPSSPTLTPRLKTNWPLRVQPYGGPYLYYRL